MTRALFHTGDLCLRRGRASAGLPPGQREISSYPRYGTSLAGDPVTQPSPSIEISGDVIETARLDAASLSRLPRREIVADLHCVAGWSARDLRWEGVLLRDVLEMLDSAHDATHLRACGRDGFRAVLVLEDALGDDASGRRSATATCPRRASGGRTARSLTPSCTRSATSEHCARDVADAGGKAQGACTPADRGGRILVGWTSRRRRRRGSYRT